MNDLGMRLAWLAVQVALVLVPSLGLHALASRRGPASGSWIAALSLGLVAALGLAAFVPSFEWGGRPQAVNSSTTASVLATPPEAASTSTSEKMDWETATRTAGQSWEFAKVRRIWATLGDRAAPPARFRPWGKTLAVVALAGTAFGLLRLMIGLWAVGHCRRRSRAVDDPELIALLDELRSSMGLLGRVELREVPDLTTPATAGWRRPMLLLPDDWRSWSESERRAVFAHELAHILRGDYATGLIARVAVALNYYHPLVRRMADRLHLQQELAADAWGARFAGGRASYLVALSRLALEQDGRSPSWPARAFLPAKGTLIRRIAMLRLEDETGSKPSVKAWSSPRRLVTALGLLGLTIGSATLRAPARAADDAPASSIPAPASVVVPFEVNYIPPDMTGVVAFRPSATCRKLGMGLVQSLTLALVDENIATTAKSMKIDMGRPGWLKLRPEDIESVIAGMGLRRGTPEQEEKAGQPQHLLMFGGMTARTVAPFDWLAFLRQWGLELETAREGDRVFYKGQGPLKIFLGGTPALYLVDDRTLVFDDEKVIRKMLARPVPSTPTYLRGADWDRVSRGIFALAINNQDGSFSKTYDLGRADDAIALSVLQGVDRWVIGLADADSLAVQAEATCTNPDASRTLARTIDPLLKLSQKEVEDPVTAAMTTAVPGLEKMLKVGQGFFAKLRVEPKDSALHLDAEGFATFADIASIVETQARAKTEAAAGAKSTKR